MLLAFKRIFGLLRKNKGELSCCISPLVRSFRQSDIFFFFFFNNLSLFSVPSIAPSGLRVSRLQFIELKVQWNPIPQHSANGRLLGYVVYYQEYPYYWYSTKRVNTSSSDVNMLVLSDLKAAHSYRVWVAGFTRAGTGPQSSSYYLTTGKLHYIPQTAN